MLFLSSTARAKWLLATLFLFCLYQYLHEHKSIIYFDHFWRSLKEEGKLALKYLCKLCWILVGTFNKELNLAMYFDIFPRHIQRLFAFRLFHELVLNCLCISDDVLLFWWTKKTLYAVLVLFWEFYTILINTVQFPTTKSFFLQTDNYTVSKAMSTMRLDCIFFSRLPIKFKISFKKSKVIDLRLEVSCENCKIYE